MKEFEQIDLSPADIHRQAELIYDPINPVSTQGPRFSGNFESGNLGQVYQIGARAYEIHLIPDPNDGPTTQWFFFRVENLEPGYYFFVIVGFYRSCNLHLRGSRACVYSENAAKSGIGWQRIGDNLNYFKWRSGSTQEWAFSFNFSVSKRDTMYFAHAYPYTYTDLQRHLKTLGPLCKPFNLTRTFGDINVPCIFWDADSQQCMDVRTITNAHPAVYHEPPEIRTESIYEFPEEIVSLIRTWRNKKFSSGRLYNRKPVCVIVARTHPGETNSSYAMEGFLNTLFRSKYGEVARKHFSWLIIPMMNVDGVICGFYRPCLSGDDMNRVWQSPDPVKHPTATAILDTLEALSCSRPLAFFLDFHGHTGACNAFVYGFGNEDNPELYASERVFPQLMTKYSNIFSSEMCSYLKQPQYEGTMRVVVRRRFLILFAYTLEMSYGGCDFGPRRDTQFTPHDYRSIGEATVRAILDMLLEGECYTAKLVMALMPPPEEVKPTPEIYSSVSISGSTSQSPPSPFTFSASDISTVAPRAVRLTLKQAELSAPKL